MPATENGAGADPRAAAPKVHVAGLSKRYPSLDDGEPRWAVRSLDLSIARGEILTVVGPSGCGKTTLLNCVAGLTTYDEGEVRIDDRAVDGPDASCAVVFQHASLLPWRSALRNAMYGMEVGRRVPKAELRERAQQAIELVGLAGYERYYPAQLSGGMRQRVNLARALATSAEVLLMDEPFGALDALTKAQMQGELMRIASEAEQTILFITHDIDEAVYLGDRVAVMTANPGRVARVIDVPFRRPRDLSIATTPEFQELRDELWGMLMGSTVKPPPGA